MRTDPLLVALTALAFAACNQPTITGEPSAKATAAVTAAPVKTAGAATATAAPTTNPADPGGAPAEKPATQGYSLSAIKTISDTCSNAKVLMASAPKSATASPKDYSWQWTKQAMLANLQFKVVRGKPSGPGQVSFSVHEEETSLALVASCADGDTCNRLAAMYKAVVRSSAPTVVCGNIPSLKGPATEIALIEGDPASNVPKKEDVVASCARLSACLIATDQSTPGNPGLECQKAPHTFKTACASRFPCAEVIACMK